MCKTNDNGVHADLTDTSYPIVNIRWLISLFKTDKYPRTPTPKLQIF